MATEWLNNVPTHDPWGIQIVDEFVDGRTRHGPWALMTPKSHEEHGVGTGLGRGQRYRKDDVGRWLKVEG